MARRRTLISDNDVAWDKFLCVNKRTHTHPALRSRTTKNPDVGTGPHARSFTSSLHSLVCSAHSFACSKLLGLLTCSLVDLLAHSRPSLWESELLMPGHEAALDHSASTRWKSCEPKVIFDIYILCFWLFQIWTGWMWMPATEVRESVPRPATTWNMSIRKKTWGNTLHDSHRDC